MTATTLNPLAPTAAPATTARLRTLLRADAAMVAVGGLIAAAAAGPVADLLGPDVSTTVVRIVGIALVVYALDLAVVSRAAARWLRPVARANGIAGIAWEVGTIALVALGVFSVAGAVVALAVAGLVGWISLLQLRAAR